jgi:hypothetical protein
MRVLIAIISYQGDADNGNNQLIRETWGKDVPAVGAELRFFIGRRNTTFVPQPDEVLVDFQQSRKCAHGWWESYVNCCQDFWQVQVRSILEWSITQEYDFTYLCSTDTFVVPRKLMATGFEKYDYSGQFIPEQLPVGVRSDYDIYAEKRYAWADVGHGLFLSKRAVMTILKEPTNYQYTDQHIAQHLGPYIERGELTGYRIPDFKNSIAWHFRDDTLRNPKGDGYQSHGARWMKQMYEEHGNDGI